MRIPVGRTKRLVVALVLYILGVAISGATLAENSSGPRINAVTTAFACSALPLVIGAALWWFGVRQKFRPILGAGLSALAVSVFVLLTDDSMWRYITALFAPFMLAATIGLTSVAVSLLPDRRPQAKSPACPIDQ